MMTKGNDGGSAQTVLKRKRVCDDKIIPVPDKIRDHNSAPNKSTYLGVLNQQNSANGLYKRWG